MHDLIVVGAGLSGLMAAYSAVEAGLSVRILATGMGSLHWAAGTIDLLGYLPHSTAPAVRRPLAALNRLPDEHPYRLLGIDGIQQGLKTFRRATELGGLEYVGDRDGPENLHLPSPVGAVRPTYLAPQAQAAGDLRRPDPMLIVGIRGLRDFYPRLIARNLTLQGYTARAAFLPLHLFTDRRDFTTVHLAEEMDAAERCLHVAQALRKLSTPGERIGLPAILGLHEHQQALNTLQNATDAVIFEIPTLPPSIPGLRLFQALRRTLLARNIRLEAGMKVIGYGSNGRKIEWVESETSARPLKHRAARFLLASGGILGGGFSSNHQGRCRETIFDLPLTVPQDRTTWFRPDFLDPDGHPIYREGVAINSLLQPVGAQGEAVFDNLWVGGNLLAGADSIRERSAEGIAVASGVAAALSVAGIQTLPGSAQPSME